MRSHPQLSSNRRGFTLVEMMVAIMIIMILAAMTVAVVNVSMETDRIRSSARQVQSYLEGARDRAIFAQAPRGVRFLLEETGITNAQGNPVTVTSMVFIGEAGGQSEGGRGTFRIEDGPPNPPDQAFRARQITGPSWTTLASIGLLSAGQRFKIINGSNETWSGIDASSFQANGSLVQPGVVYLSRPHPEYLGGTLDGHVEGLDISREHDLEYELELGSTVLANQEPVTLASGIAIDLEPVRVNPRGKFPGIWYDSTGPRYRHIDILFSPRGTVTGPAAAYGVIHFLLADVGDIERRSGYVIGQDTDGFIDHDLDGDGSIDDSERNEVDKIIVSIFTRTGHISTNPVDPTDLINNMTGANGADGFADDPFFFAEKGDVAK